MTYDGLQVHGTKDPWDDWWSEERGTEIDDYDVYDEVDEEDRPEYD